MRPTQATEGSRFALSLRMYMLSSSKERRPAPQQPLDSRVSKCGLVAPTSPHRIKRRKQTRFPARRDVSRGSWPPPGSRDPARVLKSFGNLATASGEEQQEQGNRRAEARPRTGEDAVFRSHPRTWRSRQAVPSQGTRSVSRGPGQRLAWQQQPGQTPAVYVFFSQRDQGIICSPRKRM